MKYDNLYATHLLLVDCDGTIREPLSGNKFPTHPRDQKIIQGADKAIKYYRDRGFLVIGISNQSGVASGHKSLEDAIAEQLYTLNLFPQLDCILFCPDYEGRYCWEVSFGDATGTYAMTAGEKPPSGWNGALSIADRGQERLNYRKPEPGMLLTALGMVNSRRMGLYNIPLEKCVYTGDRPEDEEAAVKAGIKFLTHTDWINGY